MAPPVVGIPEIDIGGLIVTMALWVVGGLLLGAFVLFQSKIPIIPRKYFKVEIYKTDLDTTPQLTKGWFINDGGVQKFRVLLRGLSGSWAGVNLDRAMIKTSNADGTLELIANIPGVTSASNYRPKNPVITQKDAFVSEILAAVDESGRPTLEMKIRDAFNKHSRVTDLNESRWLSDEVALKRAARNRVAGDAWLEKAWPFIALIAIAFCMYLSYDSLSKSFQTAVSGYASVTSYYTQQVVDSCGGKFISQNVSTPAPAKPSSSIIPFVGG